MYVFKSILYATTCTALLAGSANAADGFDPRQSCFEILSDATPATKIMAASWAFGFLAAKQSDPRPVDFENIDTMLNNLIGVCSQNQTMSLLEVVDKSAKPTADVGGSAANAREMLMQFYAPGADHNALTQALIPSEADIRAVYNEPLASKLVTYIAEQFTADVTFRPKPEHNDLLIVHATTTNLRNGDAVLREFPGGYKEVVQYMNEGIPIVRFKFITSGEELGLAFDGLVFVNDHWAIIPKPWRLLD